MISFEAGEFGSFFMLRTFSEDTSFLSTEASSSAVSN